MAPEYDKTKQEKRRSGYHELNGKEKKYQIKYNKIIIRTLSGKDKNGIF
jgi:hypothetical protein